MLFQELFTKDDIHRPMKKPNFEALHARVSYKVGYQPTCQSACEAPSIIKREP